MTEILYKEVIDQLNDVIKGLNVNVDTLTKKVTELKQELEALECYIADNDEKLQDLLDDNNE